ncbi:DNA repair protein RecO [Candidatus Shapirobacteria bacterium CG03_land_8_20_14_0_80_39_12]|uniref:DNA repair protein RecO n=1 Tax=Candidatus Shapirobacteria bacterium CG03_land_8_20_14_0_80_39_12 TaxID=1974879 RepID=A0A2M7BDX5_9BACT|nr:MAG: DNA repair protein RecO [Candidatus Shapirobacteria bacterium CG03_land_8_20_14_0_80_39_12]
MNIYKSEGVVLKRSNFGEADRLVTIFTKHYGKLTFVAKGVRRVTSKKGGSLEIFNMISFLAAKGRGMDILTEAETIETFSGWRKNLEKVAAAYEICEILDKLTAEASEQKEVYEFLVSSLKKINETEENLLSAQIDSFGGNLLKLLGFWPKQKAFLPNFNVCLYIEQIIERGLKSKNFLKRCQSK